ncbi:UPF0175 family protein [Chryseolinea lacunae]|uniref:UPF0175 family protein n=1 Tax=Chryseolinea lacunae TaxID=2801331 RepID=A0ABS1KT14_9BACT|nr:UPF0175 family protein [Chryseolinea lacunae]MBL0742571.1 UPF0175 family protein [Chryseolinea lacunae]
MKCLALLVPGDFEFDELGTKKFLAAKLYETGRLSLGQAAELAGLSKGAFSEIFADYDVSLINNPPSEILRDASQF